MLTYANGGPRPAMGNLESVDYKGMRALKSYHSEFHHIIGAVFPLHKCLWTITSRGIFYLGQ